MLDLRRVLLISVAAGVLTKPLAAQRLSDAAGLRALSHIDDGGAVRVQVITGPRSSTAAMPGPFATRCCSVRVLPRRD